MTLLHVSFFPYLVAVTMKSVIASGSQKQSQQCTETRRAKEDRGDCDKVK